MITNAFIGWTAQPTEAELREALGKAWPLWDRLLGELADVGVTGREWKPVSKKGGWSLRARQGDRVIVYLSPGAGELMASLALGDRAMAAAKQAGFPAAVVKILAEARRYVEGTAVRLVVRKAADVGVVAKLAAIKAAH